MKPWTLIGIVACATVVTALASARPQDPAAAAAKPAVKATVKGRALFEGEKPTLDPLPVTEDKAKGCQHEGGAPVSTVNEGIVVGKDGGLANVVVLVEVPGAKAEPMKEPLLLDQKTCRFEPHVQVLPVGSSLEFLNTDSVSHNVHTYPGKNEALNKMIAAGAKETQKLDKADRIEIKCDIHPWMNSFLIVAETPYFAVSGADGSFEIKDLPAGEYKVEYWHEKLGKSSGKIVVKPDGTCEPVEVKMSSEKKAAGKRR